MSHAKALLLLLPLLAAGSPIVAPAAEEAKMGTTSEKFLSKPPVSIQCQVQTGTSPPVFFPNLNGPTPEDVINASLAWLNDVCTVDSFLNKPRGTTPLATVIAFAVDEPTHLKTLSSVLGLSEAGKRAAAVLEANFPSVPGNLYNLQNGKANPVQVTTAINFNRCCTVLPAIRTLVREAADATGAFRPGPIPKPVFPEPCRAINCVSGASSGI